MSRLRAFPWSQSRPAPPLADHEIHVWRIPLDARPEEAAALQPLLSDDERDRADRFHFALDRTRFIVAHAALRALLARYLDTEEYRDAFHTGPNGKPALAPGASLRFNLSHSKNLALVALTVEREVGVDLESIDERVEIEALARRFFSPEECRGLLGLPEERRRDGFFHIWSQKEAYLKGRGDGVVLGLDHFAVAPDPNAPAALLDDRKDPAARERWTLLTLDPGAGFSGALAVEGASPIVRRFGWDLGRSPS